MTVIRQARAFLYQSPREAVADMAGLAGICAVVFCGFVLPVLL
ncbi:MAG: hypothetical protein AAF416_18200 [Pseudomonadota bacterium]